MTTDMDNRRPLDLSALRKRLASQHGRTYWRSLNELAESDEFIETVRHEFPRQAQLLGTLNLPRSWWIDRLYTPGSGKNPAVLKRPRRSRPRQTHVFCQRDAHGRLWAGGFGEE